jgi:hypothetical protein
MVAGRALGRDYPPCPLDILRSGTGHVAALLSPLGRDKRSSLLAWLAEGQSGGGTRASRAYESLADLSTSTKGDSAERKG